MTDTTKVESVDPQTARILTISPAKQPGTILAFAVVEFGLWIVRGVKLMRREDGSTWLAMPGEKVKGGQWRDVCFVPARSARDALHHELEIAYEAAERDGDDESSSPKVPECR